MIKRQNDIEEISNRINNYPVTTILGPRQSGKTTIAGQCNPVESYDLENPIDIARLDNPILELSKKKGLIVIDEIQKKPDIFPVLRYIVDNNKDIRFLILGSASRDLIKQSSETLAGRISYYNLYGFKLSDITEQDYIKLWIYGGFPRSFLAQNDEISFQWRYDYIRTYLERDIPALGINIASETLRRFWIMLSHYHGNILNYSELARSFGMSDKTIKNYIELLQGTFMVRILMPWYANVSKRLVKSPKLYIRDSGIFHSLQSIVTFDSLITNPKLGASWEGFALDCVTRSVNKNEEEFFFYASHADAELDLFWKHNGKNYGCEFKYSDSVKFSKSMRSVIADLELTKLWVVYPGEKEYSLSDNCYAFPLNQIKDKWVY